MTRSPSTMDVQSLVVMRRGALLVLPQRLPDPLADSTLAGLDICSTCTSSTQRQPRSACDNIPALRSRQVLCSIIKKATGPLRADVCSKRLSARCPRCDGHDAGSGCPCSANIGHQTDGADSHGRRHKTPSITWGQQRADAVCLAYSTESPT